MDQEDTTAGAVKKGYEVVKDTELGINIAKPKDMNQTNDLELANHELCDAYMNYKDLANQCVIDFGTLQASDGLEGALEDHLGVGDAAKKSKSNLEKKNSSMKEGDTFHSEEEIEAPSEKPESVKSKEKVHTSRVKTKKVYYFAPNSFLMQDPEKQRQFRDQFIAQIKAAPQLSKPRLLAEDLQLQMIESIADRSGPSDIRKLLAEFFHRKQYTLMHKRYKLLIRWAHHAIRTRNIDSIGQQATVRCSKMQWDIDSAIKRAQRLADDDDYELGLQSHLRPSSRGKDNSGTLYVEIKDLPAQSAIRQDDIEVYLRSVTYSTKVTKMVNKYLARLKWLPLSHRYDVFEGMMYKYKKLRDQNIASQVKFWDDLQKHTVQKNVITPEVQRELKQIRDNIHITTFNNSLFDERQQVLGSCRPDHDVAPDIKTTSAEVKQMILQLAYKYIKQVDVDQDDGFSFAYQLSLLFPQRFQILVIQSTFSIYDAFAGQSGTGNRFNKHKFSSMPRVDPNIFRDVATNSNLVPNEDTLSQEITDKSVKIIRLKASPWIEYVTVMPRVPDWQRRQDALISSDDNPVDSMLRGAMDFLDINDLASVNLVLAESSAIHVELADSMQKLRKKEENSKLKMNVQVKQMQDLTKKPNGAADDHNEELTVEEDVYQIVSATNIHELNNNMYVHMSNALTGANIVDKISKEKQKRNKRGGDNDDDKKNPFTKSSLLTLQSNLVQSLNTLRYMNSREAKTKILYALNYFRSIQKRLMLDLREFGTRERVLGDVIDPLLPAEEADNQLIDTYNMVLANTNKIRNMTEEMAKPDKNSEQIQKSKKKRPSESVLDDSDREEALRSIKKLKEQEKKAKFAREMEDQKKLDLNFSILPAKVMNAITNNPNDQALSLVDIKKYRRDGQFHEKHLATCPILPRYHATFGEPSEIQPDYVQADKEEKTRFISLDSMRFLNRVDHIEIDEAKQEVHVRDDYNIYIMYECSLTDMQILELELLRIGSYFISKLEELYDTEVDKVCHKKDRQQVLNDLLNHELEFQFRKVLLTQMYMEAYEHVCDPVEQHRLIKIIIDLIARRPRLNMDSFYFRDSYKAEIDCIDNNIKLLDVMISTQIKIEKQYNTNLHEQLNLSFSLAQAKTKFGWTFQNADHHLQDLIDKFKAQEHAGQLNVNYNDNDDNVPSETQDSDAPQDPEDVEEKMKQAEKAREARRKEEERKAKKPKYMRNMRYVDHELDPDAFTRLLDLPKVSLEHLFNQNKENDEILMDIMAEQSHYVHLIEGYPDLMSLKHSGKASETNEYRSTKQDTAATQQEKSATNRPDLTFSQPDQVQELQIKLNKWLKRSQAMSIMDFYSDALAFVSKLQATIVQSTIELEDALRPHDNMMRSLLESAIFEQALLQFREIQQIMIGQKIEYKGREYIEDESTVGSADNMLFRIKEFHSTFNSQTKITQNPFLMAKLDMTSIKQIKFPPRIKKNQNPYVRKQDLLEEGKHLSIAIAEHKYNRNPTTFMRHYLRNFEDELLTRTSVLYQTDQNKAKLKLKPPIILQMTCNAVEFVRLRSELILCLSECAVLQQIYLDQVNQCNQQGYKPLYSEGLAFENGIVPSNEVNYVDDGPAHNLDLELAINEVDKSCVSNLNFRNPDSFKMMTTKCGLEELRLVLHYQMMQKQALIVATRINQCILDTHVLALKELHVLENYKFATPNMIVPVDNCFGLGQPQQVERPKLNRVKNKYKSELVGILNLLIVSISSWKGSQRTNLGKKYQEMVALCEKNYQHKEVKLRALRSFKVSLFNQYCNQVLEQVYADSLKYNMLAQCQKLRNINQYFQFNPVTMNITTNENGNGNSNSQFAFSQLFDLESSDLMENGSYWYSIANYKEQLKEDVKKNRMKSQDISLNKLQSITVELPEVQCIDYKKREQVDIFSLPSTRKIVQMNVFESQEERQKFFKSSLEEVNFDFNDNQVEGKLLLKKILPSANMIDDASARTDLNDFQKLKYVQMLRYYQHVENIIQLELSVSKFTFSSELVAEMDNSMQMGLAFFQSRFPMAPEWTTSPCSGDLASIINSGKAYQNIEATEQGKKIQQDQKEFEERHQDRNKLSIKIMNKLFQRRRLKADVGEEFYAAAQRIKETLLESRKHGEKSSGKKHFSSEYLAKYEQIRYLQIVSTLMKMNEHFLSKMQVRAGKALQDALLALSGRDHISIMQTNGSANINAADVAPQRVCIESTSLYSFFNNKYETLNFHRCVCPILSDQALEPQEITLLHSIFLNNSQVSATNGQEGIVVGSRAQKCLPYVGSVYPTMAFKGSDLGPLQTYLLCLDSSQRQYITSNFRQMDSLLEDYLCYIVNESLKDGELNPSIKTLTFSQLKLSKRFLTDQIDSRQLKLAILCFMGHEMPQKLMASPQITKQIEEMYKKELLWKILKEKDLQRSAQEARYRSNLQREEMLEAQKNLEDEILRLEQMDERKITDEDVSRAQKLKIKQLEQEHQSMRRNVLLDSILFNRSSTVVIQQEIERILIQAAIDTLNNESTALASCLKNQAKEIEAYIHPFQQYAVTLYDKVDPLSHLDPINKCSQIQSFLTRLKNRGTEVETLTSGPGYVFTLKDINDCVATLTKGLLKYSEQEMRTRCELFAKKEQHLYNLLYVKDQQIESLERRMDKQTADIDKLVNARMYEKGNIIVFELDQVNRQLKLMKDSVFLMEQRIFKEIEDQFKNKIIFKDARIGRIKDQFVGYKNEILKQQDALIAQRRDFIEKELGLKDKEGREIRKGRIPLNFIENEQSPGKYLMQREGNNQIENGGFAIKARKMSTGGVQLPLTREELQKQIEEQRKVLKGESKSKFPDDVNELGKPYRMPTQLQELKHLDEAEARLEVASYTERMRLMYLFWKVKEVTLKQRYENQIYALNQKVSSNSMLWEQLAESEKREAILRQELVMTQQTLNNTQLIVDKQKDTIKKLDTENTRLMNFKHSKGKRLDELEKKVTQYELFQKIDVDKLIHVLHKQQGELTQLRRQDQIQAKQLQNMYRSNKEELREVHRKYANENMIKNSVIERLEQTRQQMKVLEVNNGSVAAIWKEKCMELADMCTQLQSENEMLNAKTQHLANVTVNLLGTLNEYHQVQSELARMQENPTKQQSAEATDDVRRSNSNTKRQQASSKMSQHDSNHGMSLPKLVTSSMFPGQLQIGDTRSKQSLGSGMNSNMRSSVDRARAAGIQAVNPTNFTASHEFKNRHLIFKNPEAANVPKPAKKRGGGHNRGRSLLDIQREFERESRIGKLQKAMAEQSLKGDFLQQSFNEQSLSTQVQKSDFVDLFGRPKQQRDTIQQMQDKNRLNLNKAMSLSKELKDSLLESSIYSVPHRFDQQVSVLQNSYGRSPMGQHRLGKHINPTSKNSSIGNKANSGLISRRSFQLQGQMNLPETQLQYADKDNIRMHDESMHQNAFNSQSIQKANQDSSIRNDTMYCQSTQIAPDQHNFQMMMENELKHKNGQPHHSSQFQSPTSGAMAGHNDFNSLDLQKNGNPRQLASENSQNPLQYASPTNENATSPQQTDHLITVQPRFNDEM